MAAKNYYKLKPPPLFQEPVKQRKCLKCDLLFMSIDGARICVVCSKKNSGVARRVDVGQGSVPIHKGISQ